MTEPEQLVDDLKDRVVEMKSELEYLKSHLSTEEDEESGGDGKGVYEHRITVTKTSKEMGRDQAEQHCRKIAGTIDNDSAMSQYEIRSTKSVKVEDEGDN